MTHLTRTKREREGQYRRRAPWERRHDAPHPPIAAIMSDEAGAFVDQFLDAVDAAVGKWDTLPPDITMSENDLPEIGEYQIVLNHITYQFNLEMVFHVTPEPRHRVRGRLLNGPLTEQGKRPLVALTLAQFKALNPVQVGQVEAVQV